MFRGCVSFQEGSPQRKQGGIQCRDEVVKTYGHPRELFGSQTQTGTIFLCFLASKKLSILYSLYTPKTAFFIILLLYTFKVLKTNAIY